MIILRALISWYRLARAKPQHEDAPSSIAAVGHWSSFEVLAPKDGQDRRMQESPLMTARFRYSRHPTIILPF